MIIFFVGPSAVGKTTLGRACATQERKYDFIDLDEAVAQLNHTSTADQSAIQFGLEKFLSDCREIAAAYDLQYANSVLLVALGEWVLRMENPEAWLSQYRTISLMAPADEVFQRRHNLIDMSFEDYCRFHYSEARKKIFANCDIALNIGNLTEEQAVEVDSLSIDSSLSVPVEPTP
jgi:shikimate kinase